MRYRATITIEFNSKNENTARSHADGLAETALRYFDGTDADQWKGEVITTKLEIAPSQLPQ